MAVSVNKTTSKSKKLYVAAIDFGTTYSGYAFSSRDDFETQATKVSAPTSWVGGSTLLSHKTPTVLLLDSSEEFVAFGYEAEDKFAGLATDDEHRDHYYFRRFKMKLYEIKHLSKSLEIKDENGKSLNAIKVFSICIGYFYKHLLETVEDRVGFVDSNDVLWVLTVPAIWNDGAKQFMREAAVKAGLPSDDLIIALEPEAASLFCMHIPVETLTDVQAGANLTRSTVSPFRAGSKYMVVDAGGGTIDVTVHQVVDETSGRRTLRELLHASGGNWGGVRVDDAFQDFLAQLFGEDVMKRFKDDYIEDWIELMRQFEIKKRAIHPNKHDKETLNIHLNLMEIFNETSKKTIDERIEENPKLKGKIKIPKGKGKFRVESELMQSWFSDSLENTEKHVQRLIDKPECADVNTLLLVGGFSDSKMLQNAVKKCFHGKKLIIPDDAGLAVLKGAVLFGHDPLIITHRVAKVTYGIRVYKPFEKGNHLDSKQEVFGGVSKCKDVFSVHVRKNTVLEVGKPEDYQDYTPLEGDQVSLQFDIYTSTKKDPKYTDEPESSYLGQLDVQVPGEGKDRTVQVQMTYGGTELIVAGKIKGTNRSTSTKFDFLHDPATDIK